MTEAASTPRAGGESYLMLGSVVCTTILAGKETNGQIGLIDMRCPKGSGPGPHTDPWRESFYVIEGEIEFMLERAGALEPVKAGPGDAVSIPAGLGHAFRAISQGPARALIISLPAGLEEFFAEAGARVSTKSPPETSGPFDLARFEKATDRYGIKRFSPSASERE